jgi:hypothetical protein
MIKQCFECKADIKFKANYFKMQKKAPSLLEHAKQRQHSFDLFRAKNGGQMPKNDWPSEVKQVIEKQKKEKELKDWPRIPITVEDGNGMACIAADDVTKLVDHHDTFHSLRYVMLFIRSAI